MRILHVGSGFSPYLVSGLVIYADDLMREQSRAGHQVGYLCAGRHYPFLRGPHLRRWCRAGVTMFEWINSPIVIGRILGSPQPAEDRHQPACERVMDRVLERFAPDVVHLQDLAGWPSSLIDVAGRANVPCVLTAHDYFTLCPTVRLFDADGENCRRLRPGAMCVICCHSAPFDSEEDRRLTREYHIGQLRRNRAVTFVRPVLAPMRWAARTAKARLRARPPVASEAPFQARAKLNPAAAAEPAPPPAASAAAHAGALPVHALPVADAAAYQRRREEGIDHLNRLDRLLVYSDRSGAIFTDLGVHRARLQKVHVSPRHVVDLRPRSPVQAHLPVRFAALNAMGAIDKGAGLLVDCVRELDRRGLSGRFELHLHGWARPDLQDALSPYRHVRVRGRYSTDELDGLLEHADVGIVPSLWEEVLGFVGLEFLVKGIPVIGNAVGGIPEYTRDGRTGWLNRSCTAAGLADIMATLIAEPSRVREMAVSALAVRDDFRRSMPQQAQDIVAIYRDVRDNRQAAAGGSSQAKAATPVSR